MSAINLSHDDVTPVVYRVYSIRDVKTNVYNSPYFQTHKAGAIRMFMDLCTDPQSTIKKHPADFQLYELGTFNSETGKFTSHQEPIYLSSPSDFSPPSA